MLYFKQLGMELFQRAHTILLPVAIALSGITVFALFFYRVKLGDKIHGHIGFTGFTLGLRFLRVNKFTPCVRAAAQMIYLFTG